MQKNTVCLWYNNDAVDAAHFYANTFPGSSVGKVFHAPSDFPGGKAGDVLTVEFTVCGVPCIGLNGGDVFKHSEAFSFQIATDDQAETDIYWNAIIDNGGTASECGWCKDKWGLLNNELCIHKMLNSLQGARYMEICERKKKQEEFVRSWFSRVYEDPNPV